MSRLKIYKDEYADKTAVSNCFIDKYMIEANDAQLKVYLYLLRTFQAGQTTSVSDIADKFNYTEKDIIRALKYWEKKNLLNLDYDEDKTLVGIRLRELSYMSAPNSSNISDSGQEITDNVFVKDAFLHKEAGCISQLPANLGGITSLVGQSLTNERPSFEKPIYTADQLRAFKNRETTGQLLFIVESYIGKPLSPSEIKSVLFFSDVLNFSNDLIDYLIQYCVDRGKKDFKYIEKVAINWAEEGISTPEQAQKSSGKYSQEVYSIMNALGRNTTPTPKEMEYINRWTKEYAFTVDIIVEACERTVLATDKHRFEYADSILSSWSSKGVHHKADIHTIDDVYQQRKKTSAKPAPGNKFNQFTQNNYDFDALEKELLSN